MRRAKHENPYSSEARPFTSFYLMYEWSNYSATENMDDRFSTSHSVQIRSLKISSILSKVQKESAETWWFRDLGVTLLWCSEKKKKKKNL